MDQEASAAVDALATPDLELSVSEPLRRLVTVQKVLALEPIEGKDKIECATILGYKVVVTKGLRVGQLVAYHEVDSFVPTGVPAYAFLDSTAKDTPTGRRARIRTKKFGDFYSQGLVLRVIEDLALEGNFFEDDDLTTLLDVRKYEPPSQRGIGSAPQGGRRHWPEDAPPKTDEERLQSRPRLLEEMQGKSVYIASKIDGQSMTVYRRFAKAAPGDDPSAPGELVICSRNHQIPLHDAEGNEINRDNAYVRTALALGLDRLDVLPPGYCLQGEHAGPGIQANRLGLKEKCFYVFNVFRRFPMSPDAEEAPELEQLEMREARSFVQEKARVAGTSCLKFVPVVISHLVINTQPKEDGPHHDVAHFVNLASDAIYDATQYPGEGIVVRPLAATPSKVLKGARLSFKVINPKFEALQ